MVKQFVFFFESPFFSGAEMQGIRNARHLLEKGHSVDVVFRRSADLESEIKSRLGAFGAKLKPYSALSHSPQPSSGKFQAAFADAFLVGAGFIQGVIYFLTAKNRIVHVNNGGYPGAGGARGFALAAVLFSHASRIIFTVNNQAVPYKRLVRYFQWPIDFLLANSRIVWVTGSKNAADTLKRVLRLGDSKVFAIRNGPISECKCPGIYKRKPAWPRTKKVVALQVGHLELRKGQDVLMNAVFSLKTSERFDRTWLVAIEGEGPLLARLQDLQKKLDLSHEVLLLGRDECVHHLYKEVNFLVHPSTFNDDLPNVVSEAMQIGLPVLASRIAGLPEQVAEGQTGLLVEPGNVEELAGGLYQLFIDSDIRSRMSAQARRRYQELLSPDRATIEFENFYLEREAPK